MSRIAKTWKVIETDSCRGVPNLAHLASVFRGLSRALQLHSRDVSFVGMQRWRGL